MAADKDVLNEMLALVAIIEEGSFSAASKQLGLTKSAVSKIIARLEARLRCRLLSRTTRRVQATELGASYYEGAKRILEAVETLELDIENRGHELRGLLRISAPVMLGQAVVLPIVLAFQQAHPELRVEVELSDRLIDLVEERIDVAVRMTDTPPQSFVARRLGDDERVFCASPAYLASRGVPEGPADLARHDGIHLIGDHLPVPWRLRPDADAVQLASYRLQSRIRLNTIEGIRMAALAGLGIADLPRYLVQADLDSERLVMLLQDYQPSPRSIWAIYPPSRFVPKKVTGFVAALSSGFDAAAITKQVGPTPKRRPKRPRSTS